MIHNSAMYSSNGPSAPAPAITDPGNKAGRGRNAKAANAKALVAQPEAENSRDKLVAAAELLFVKKGFSAVSIREIASAAAVNSALINYYFGGKEGLFRLVYKAAVAPMNVERERRFDALVASHCYELEAVLDAWIRPMFQSPLLSDSAPIADLSLSVGWDHAELAGQLTSEVYDAMNEKFLSLLEKCLPGLSRTTLVWRLFFLIGAVLTATRHHERSMTSMSRGRCDGRDSKEMITQLVAFAAAGFRASSPRTSRI